MEGSNGRRGDGGADTEAVSNDFTFFFLMPDDGVLAPLTKLRHLFTWTQFSPIKK